jgi:antitoxin ParD1/3/4/toxin ParE1/3/4
VASYRLTEPAQRDLAAIIAYVCEQYSVEAAIRVSNELESAMKDVAANPSKGHVRPDLTNEELLFQRCGRTLIVYKPDTTPLEIIAVAGGGRDTEPLLGQRTTPQKK